MPKNKNEQTVKSNSQPSTASREKDPRHQVEGQSQAQLWTKLPTELQQLVLNTFRHELLADHTSLKQIVQEVKHHLYERNFLKAFEIEAYREAYALRWSPSRALAYASIFCHLDPLDLDQSSKPQDQRITGTTDAYDQGLSPVSRIVCLGGGGGAELIGLATYLHWCKAGFPKESDRSHEVGILSFDCTIVDLADWSSVTEKLLTTLASNNDPPDPSNAGSLHVPCMTANFKHQDILNLTPELLQSECQGVKLVTIMFTLNELYSTSMSKTTTLLLGLTDVLGIGALLLVVDSPGSYSTVGIVKDGQEKKYPMQWLLDRTLLDSAAGTAVQGKEKVARWKKVEGIESRWFRLAKGLMYPIDLEDMRYQLHLYRKL